MESTYQIAVIGDSGVGKTSLVSYFLKGRPDIHWEPTIGALFHQRRLTAADGLHELIFQIWDTAGQERFRAITRFYYKYTQGCLCVFDVTNRRSFESIHYWIQDYTKIHEGPHIIVIVGNKTDYPPSEWKVEQNEVVQMAQKYGASYIFTNSTQGEGVLQCFLLLARQIDLHKDLQPTKSHDVSITEEPKVEKTQKECWC